MLPDWRDWDHLGAQMLQRRDVFLTWDKAILRLTTRLEQLGRFARWAQAPSGYIASTCTNAPGRCRPFFRFTPKEERA
jgi:hypothetical protein